MINLMGADVGIQDVKPRAGDILVDHDTTIDLEDARSSSRSSAGPDKGRSVRLASEGEDILHQQRNSREKPAIPWLLEGNHDLALETMRKMKAFLPADTVIVPGHGRPTTIEASLTISSLISKLWIGRRAAVANGLSLEETVKVAAEAFSATRFTRGFTSR